MSQHNDFTKTLVSNAIKNNWNEQKLCQMYSELLESLEYDDSFANPTHLIDMAEYMLTQKDGLYGVTHEQIANWLKENMAGLIISKVLFDRKK